MPKKQIPEYVDGIKVQPIPYKYPQNQFQRQCKKLYDQMNHSYQTAKRYIEEERWNIIKPAVMKIDIPEFYQGQKLVPKIHKKPKNKKQQYQHILARRVIDRRACDKKREQTKQGKIEYYTKIINDWENFVKERDSLKPNLTEEEKLQNKRKYHRDWQNNRYQTDPLFKLKKIIRDAIRSSLFLGKNGRKTQTILGCSFDELRIHLQSKFQPGMTWENFGMYGWHIDHIIPLYYGNTDAEIIKLNHYTNLQPLWAKDNLLKGTKLPEDFQI